MEMELSPDQAQALDILIEKMNAKARVLTFVGPAGSGKTTVMRALVKRLREARYTVALCAPTNKAKLRLAEQTGETVMTVASRLYSKFVETETGDLICTDARSMFDGAERIVLIVDEASMIGSRTHNDLVEKNPDIQIVYVGDKAQLPPVNDTWGADLQNPDAELAQIHRQAQGNPIIGLATATRRGLQMDWLNTWRIRGEAEWRAVNPGVDLPPVRIIAANLDQTAAYYAGLHLAGDDVQALTFTHDVRRAFNLCVMKRIPTDTVKVVATRNMRDEGIVNGETYTMSNIRRSESTKVITCNLTDTADNCIRSIRVLPESLWEADFATVKEWQAYTKIKYPLVSARFGHCLTIHQSQGSQWEHVIVLMDDRTLRDNRLFYTAVTRAAKRLTLVAIQG
jgi:exodeoxyribonuclease V